MAKIEISPDCGNSPRKIFLADLNTAFTNGDIQFITDVIPETILWNKIGQGRLDGKENYIAELKRSPIWKVKKLIIETIITHGPDASVSGEIIARDNSKFSFCDIYRFKGSGGTTIQSISSFMIRNG